MKAHKKKKTAVQNLLVPAMVAIVMIGGVGLVVKIMLTDTGPARKNKITTVSLVKPPPDQPKEKLPEPEPPKEIPKQTIESPVDVPQDAPQQANQAPDDGPPAGSDLGVDAEGGAGSDGFGLVGKKGGRALTLGGGGGGGGMNKLSLLAKYGWYTKKVEKELWQRVKSILDQDGGFPKGKHQATVHLVLSGNGTILRSRIVGPSGSDRMDRALKTALVAMKVSESLPDGMPSGMTIKISSQG